MKIIPVILSGGSGTRLWPLSRKQYPKQYLPLVSNNSILQDTILRLNGLDNLEPPIIICNIDHRFLIAEQCQQVNITNPTILLEPVGRNTAPAIVAAALQAIKQSDDAVLLVMPSDHVIQDIKPFQKAINIAIREAQNGKLVTFGIMPTDANTDYGYIHKGKAVHGVFKVEKFIEKPGQESADIFFKSGNYLWNSGMFMFHASTLVEELNVHSPDIIQSVGKSIDKAIQDLDFIRLDKQAFVSSPSSSIDYALMEKSNNVVVIPLNVKWNDVGSWPALYDISEKDSNGNIVIGDVLTEQTFGTYINATHHMVATIGVKDLVIVDTPNATLISTRDKANSVKKIVDKLQLQNRDEELCHRKVYRPWGWYDSIELGEYFQVKRLFVKPGAKLSLQIHRKRAEHWVVVVGTATVINGEEVLILNKGESTYIPLGTSHSLENKDSVPLEVIEVQSGIYLGEDDIVRLEDVYGRIDTER